MDRDDARSLALPATLLAFGAASLLFDLGCVLIKTPFLRPGVTVGDAIETLGVYVVLAFFARAVRLAGGSPRLAGLAAVTFAVGHGIHVAANSLHDLADRMAAGDPFGLLDFWDEHASHYLIDVGRLLFAASLFVLPEGPGRPGRASRSAMWLATAGGAAYGFITFASGVEGQTVPLVLPFYLVAGGWLAVTALGAAPRLGEASVRRFYAAATVTALVFFAIWGVWHRGFPEFTETGILHGAGGRQP